MGRINIKEWFLESEYCIVYMSSQNQDPLCLNLRAYPRVLFAPVYEVGSVAHCFGSSSTYSCAMWHCCCIYPYQDYFPSLGTVWGWCFLQPSFFPDLFPLAIPLSQRRTSPDGASNIRTTHISCGSVLFSTEQGCLSKQWKKLGSGDFLPSTAASHLASCLTGSIYSMLIYFFF